MSYSPLPSKRGVGGRLKPGLLTMKVANVVHHYLLSRAPNLNFPGYTNSACNNSLIHKDIMSGCSQNAQTRYSLNGHKVSHFGFFLGYNSCISCSALLLHPQLHKIYLAVNHCNPIGSAYTALGDSGLDMWYTCMCKPSVNCESRHSVNSTIRTAYILS